MLANVQYAQVCLKIACAEQMNETKTLVGEESSVEIRRLEPIFEGIRAAEGYSPQLIYTPSTIPIRETRSRDTISQDITRDPISASSHLHIKLRLSSAQLP